MTHTNFYTTMMIFTILAASNVGCSQGDHNVGATSGLTGQAKSLLSEYNGDIEVSEPLLKAYAAFVENTKVATEANLATHCAPGTVRITTDHRPQNQWMGQDMNVHFLRSSEFQANILQIQQLDGRRYFFRTGSSGISFIQADSGIWKIDDYFDKPID